MSAPSCPSCGRPLGRRLATCPYCGERIPGTVWRMAALALVVAMVVLLEVAAFSRLGARRFFGVFTALPHMPQARFWLALAAIILFAPFPRPRPGTASVGRFRRAAAIIARLLALALLAQIAAARVTNLAKRPDWRLPRASAAGGLGARDARYRPGEKVFRGRQGDSSPTPPQSHPH